MISKLEDFKVYNLAMEVGEEVWSVVMAWGYFEKDTVGVSEPIPEYGYNTETPNP